MRDAGGCFRGLVAESPRVHAGIGPAPDGFRVVDELLPLPTAKRVHLLVPARSRAGRHRGAEAVRDGSGRSATAR